MSDKSDVSFARIQQSISTYGWTESKDEVQTPQYRMKNKSWNFIMCGVSLLVVFVVGIILYFILENFTSRE